MKFLPATYFAVLLLAVCAPGAGSASTGKPDTYPLFPRFTKKSAAAPTGLPPAGDMAVDGAANEGNESVLYPAQPWYRLLGGNAGENEETKITGEAKHFLQDNIPGTLGAMLDVMRSMNAEEIREAASAQVGRIHARRQAMFSELKIPEAAKRLMNDPQIRKDALEMAVGLAGLSVASMLWKWPAVPPTGSLALYVVGLMSLLQGAKDMVEKVMADEDVSESLENASASARSHIGKLLNLGRVKVEKAAEDVEAA